MQDLNGSPTPLTIAAAASAVARLEASPDRPAARSLSADLVTTRWWTEREREDAQTLIFRLHLIRTDGPRPC